MQACKPCSGLYPNQGLSLTRQHTGQLGQAKGRVSHYLVPVAQAIPVHTCGWAKRHNVSQCGTMCRMRVRMCVYTCTWTNRPCIVVCVLVQCGHAAADEGLTASGSLQLWFVLV